jgi:hypothetical protein
VSDGDDARQTASAGFQNYHYATEGGKNLRTEEYGSMSLIQYFADETPSSPFFENGLAHQGHLPTCPQTNTQQQYFK